MNPTACFALGLALATGGCTAKTVAEDAVETTRQATRPLAGRLAGSADEAAEDSITAVLAEGDSIEPALAQLSKALEDVVDPDVTLEPIYQRVDDRAAMTRVARAIGHMPHTEVFEEVTVGFQDLSSLDSSPHLPDAGYLVIWHRDFRLVGFVYRSRHEIHLDQLVALTPRLMARIRAATAHE